MNTTADNWTGVSAKAITFSLCSHHTENYATNSPFKLSKCPAKFQGNSSILFPQELQFEL